MRLNEVWRGRFPKYWDVTNWSLLLPDHLIICHRNEETNRRTLEIIELKSNESRSVQTIYNCILGFRDNQLYLARIADARSHLQIDRIGAFDIYEKGSLWEVNERFLVEKYKLPLIDRHSSELLALGNRKINLKNGDLSEHKQTLELRWKLDEHYSMMQQNNSLICVSSSGKTKWVLEGFLGNEFQGTTMEQMFFYKQNDQILILDKVTSNVIDSIEVSQIRRITNRIFGDFLEKNDVSYDNTTIADCLINKSVVAWISDNNALMIKDRFNRTTQSFVYPKSSTPILSQISGNNFLMYVIEEEDYGSLIVGTSEE